MIVNSPAAERNTEAISGVLKAELDDLAQLVAPKFLSVLEVASGPGQHIEAFGRLFPAIRWHPSEPDARLRDSIDERITLAGLSNVAKALPVSVRSGWQKEVAVSEAQSADDLLFDMILAVNLLHISPWEVTCALMAGAATLLKPGGTLMLYGPYSERGRHNSKGNQEFDADLRARNASWGIRNLEDVAQEGATVGLSRLRVITMPANNRTLLFNAP